MDLGQRKYAMSRVQEALSQKLQQLTEDCTLPNKGITDRQKLDAIRRGDVELRRAALIGDTLKEAFDFSGLEPETEVDRVRYDAQAAVIRGEASRVKDLIMLGEEAEALAAIRKFCNE